MYMDKEMAQVITGVMIFVGTMMSIMLGMFAHVCVSFMGEIVAYGSGIVIGAVIWTGFIGIIKATWKEYFEDNRDEG